MLHTDLDEALEALVAVAAVDKELLHGAALFVVMGISGTAIVDELVTNAIFNAPRDADGKAKYRKLHRSEELVLADDEAATLQFACDGDFIAVSTVDPFGSLDQDTVIDYLNRCLVKGPQQMSDDSGGAGLYRGLHAGYRFGSGHGLRTQTDAAAR